jgi:long-chain acyl-CoA synthetase
MPETFLTSTSHSNFTQASNLTPLQVQMDGLVSTFVERTMDGYALAGIVSGGIANGWVKGSLLQFARPLVRMAPSVLSVTQGGALVAGLITEGAVFHVAPQGLKVLAGGDLSLLHLYGVTGLGEGSLHSITGLAGLKIAGVATASFHSIVQNFAQASAMVASNHAAAFLGIGDRPREDMVHQLTNAEGTVLNLWVGMRILNQAAPGHAQWGQTRDLKIQSITVGAGSLRPKWSRQELLDAEIMGAAIVGGETPPLPNRPIKMSSLESTGRSEPVGAVREPPLPTENLPEGDYWKVTKRIQDSESDGYFLHAEPKVKNAPHHGIEGDFYDLFIKFPDLAKKLDIVLHPDGSIDYPDWKALNHRLEKEDYSFRFWDPMGRASDIEILKHLALKIPELPYSSTGAEHFHDLIFHLLGYCSIPEKVLIHLRDTANFLLSLKEDPLLQEPAVQALIDSSAKALLSKFDGSTANFRSYLQYSFTDATAALKKFWGILFLWDYGSQAALKRIIHNLENSSIDSPTSPDALARLQEIQKSMGEACPALEEFTEERAKEILQTVLVKLGLEKSPSSNPPNPLTLGPLTALGLSATAFLSTGATNVDGNSTAGLLMMAAMFTIGMAASGSKGGGFFERFGSFIQKWLIENLEPKSRTPTQGRREGIQPVELLPFRHRILQSKIDAINHNSTLDPLEQGDALLDLLFDPFWKTVPRQGQFPSGLELILKALTEFDSVPKDALWSLGNAATRISSTDPRHFDIILEFASQFFSEDTIDQQVRFFGAVGGNPSYRTPNKMIEKIRSAPVSVAQLEALADSVKNPHLSFGLYKSVMDEIRSLSAQMGNNLYGECLYTPHPHRERYLKKYFGGKSEEMRLTQVNFPPKEPANDNTPPRGGTPGIAVVTIGASLAAFFSSGAASVNGDSTIGLLMMVGMAFGAALLSRKTVQAPTVGVRAQSLFQTIAQWVDPTKENNIGILFSDNRPELFEITMGTKRAGLSYTIFNYYEPGKLLVDKILQHHYTTIFVDNTQLDRLTPFLRKLSDKGIRVISVEGDEYSRLVTQPTDARALPAQTPDTYRGPIVFTSGTTGQSKMIRQSSTSTEDQRARKIFGIHRSDRHLVLGPLFHAAPWSWAMGHLKAGAEVVLHEGSHFDPQAVFRTIRDQKITTLFLVPTMIRRLVEAVEASDVKPDLSSLRAVFVNSAPFPSSLKKKAVSLFGPKVWEYYGTTEAGLLTILDSQHLLTHSTTVGKAAPGIEIEIRSESGIPLPFGTKGSIYVRTPRTGDKFVDTHDIGSLNNEGFLSIEGRKTDLIITGGVNVFPREIENAAALVAGVRECAVLGVPDPEWGERVVMVVVPEEGATLTQGAILEALKPHLDRRKLPKNVIFRNEIPRNPAGKVDKEFLRAVVEESLSTPSKSSGGTQGPLTLLGISAAAFLSSGAASVNGNSTGGLLTLAGMALVGVAASGRRGIVERLQQGAEWLANGMGRLVDRFIPDPAVEISPTPTSIGSAQNRTHPYRRDPSEIDPITLFQSLPGLAGDPVKQVEAIGLMREHFHFSNLDAVIDFVQKSQVSPYLIVNTLGQMGSNHPATAERVLTLIRNRQDVDDNYKVEAISRIIPHLQDPFPSLLWLTNLKIPSTSKGDALRNASLHPLFQEDGDRLIEWVRQQAAEIEYHKKDFVSKILEKTRTRRMAELLEWLLSPPSPGSVDIPGAQLDNLGRVASNADPLDIPMLREAMSRLRQMRTPIDIEQNYLHALVSSVTNSENPLPMIEAIISSNVKDFDKARSLCSLARKIHPEYLPNILQAIQDLPPNPFSLHILFGSYDFSDSGPTLSEAEPYLGLIRSRIENPADRGMALSALGSHPGIAEAEQIVTLVENLPIDNSQQARNFQVLLKNHRLSPTTYERLMNKLASMHPDTFVRTLAIPHPHREDYLRRLYSRYVENQAPSPTRTGGAALTAIGTSLAAFFSSGATSVNGASITDLLTLAAPLLLGVTVVAVRNSKAKSRRLQEQLEMAGPNNQNEDQRIQVIEKFGRNQEFVAAPLLQTILVDPHESKMVRSVAAISLGQMKARTAGPLLVPLAETRPTEKIWEEKSKSKFLRLSALAALGEIGEPNSLPLFRGILTAPHEDPDIICKAIEILANKKDSVSVPRLHAIVEGPITIVYTPEVHRAAILALGKIGHSTSKNFLRHLLSSSDAFQCEILFTLVKLGDAEALEQLKKLANKKTAPSATRSEAIKYLSKLEDPSLISTLKPLRKDPDPSIRREAQKALKRLEKGKKD